MSRSKAKRRKVWLQITTGADEGFCEETRLKASASKEKGYAPFIERLPGDVVRTKNEEVALESAIDRYTEAWETAYATHTDEARRAVTACGRNLRALLRGRR